MVGGHCSRHSRRRQDDVGGHSDGEATVLVVDSQPDLEGLDVALGPADVALCSEGRIDAAVEDRAVMLGPRRQAYFEPVADADAIDIALLDVGADPEVVRV